MEGAHLTIPAFPPSDIELSQPAASLFSASSFQRLCTTQEPFFSLPPHSLSFFGVYILQILAGCYHLPCSPSSARTGSCLSLTCSCKPVLPDVTYVPGSLGPPPVPLPGQLRG